MFIQNIQYTNYSHYLFVLLSLKLTGGVIEELKAAPLEPLKAEVGGK